MRYEISKEVGTSDFFFSGIIDNSRPPHIHSHMEFIYVLKGNITVTISDKNYFVSEGNMAMSMPYEAHEYEYESGAHAFVLACPPEYFSKYRQLLAGKIFTPPTAKYGDIHRILIENIINENYRDDLKKKALLYCAISEFFNSSQLSDSPVFEYDIYRKAIVYISENFKDNITLKKTALSVGVTPEHLSRVLNSNGKRGFSDILNSLRIYEARTLIEKSNMPISEIAMESGFGSIRNFNRIFQKHFGCKPSEIKR